ncbi:MAG: hypothetical protein AAGK02_15065 [Pseudomonadota bacterium]
MDSPTPLLDLDTMIDRPAIKIDGKKYEILSAEELSVIDTHRFGRWGKQIQALSNEDGEQAEAELEQLIKRVARKVAVGVPEEVFGKLTGQAQWAIVDLFTALLLRRTLKVAGAMQTATGTVPEALQTGEASFPGSSGSMADHRRHGWLKSLLPLSWRT